MGRDGLLVLYISMNHQANTKSYDHLLIKRFSCWSVYLHENQCYLGRLVIWSHHEEFVDIFDLDDKALKEIVLIGRILKRTLDDLFAPDLYNWASLANVVRHQHVHLIPRYSRKVEQSGVTFTDSRWGNIYAPYDETSLFRTLS